MNIDTKRTQENLNLIREIKEFGFPIDILRQMLLWNKRKKTYKQLKLF